MRHSLLRASLGLLVVLCAGPAAGQGDSLAAGVGVWNSPAKPTAAEPAYAERAADFLAWLFEGRSPADLAENRDFLIRTANSLLDSEPGALGFVNDLNLRLKAFHGDHDGEGNTSVGFSYAYEKAWENEFQSDDFSRYMGFDAAFSARGNVAFDHNTNPEDFLDTRFTFSYFHSEGGAAELTEEEAEAWRATREAATCIDDWGSDETCRRIQAAFAEAGVDATTLTLDDFAERAHEIAREKLGHQFGFETSGYAAFESNQDFSDSQLVYGLHWAGAVKGWRDLRAERWSEVSWLGRANLFDYPFALVRFVAGTTEGFAPSAMAFPSLLVGAGLVDPQANDARARAGDDGNFLRVNAELAFKTLLFDLEGDGLLGRLGDVYFTTSYRYYQEIGARSSVKRAGLDDFHYVVVTLSGSSGLFVSYANGALPFDERNDELVELGWKVHF